MAEYKADMHIHTEFSFDSKMTIPEIIKILEEKKLKYIALTDHIEFSNQPFKEVVSRIKTRNALIDELQKSTEIKIVKGIEISEPHLYQPEIEYLKEIDDIDYILGSIHHIYGMPIRKMTHNKNLYNLYLMSMLKMVLNSDIDTLAHMDYIKRCYQGIDKDPKLITEILKTIIERDIALEINTSGVRRCGEFFPSNEIIEEYSKLGGSKVTFGSDAHKQNELYDNIEEASELIDKYNLSPGIIIKRRFKNIK